MAKIVDIQMGRLAKFLEQRKITLDLDAAARDWLADKGYDPAPGLWGAAAQAGAPETSPGPAGRISLRSIRATLTLATLGFAPRRRLNQADEL